MGLSEASRAKLRRAYEVLNEVFVWLFSALALALPIAGEFNQGIALMQFCCAPTLGLGMLGGIALEIARGKRRYVLLIPVCILGIVLSFRLTGGVPIYVERRAEPIITAIRHYHDMHGTYPQGGLYSDHETPPELRDVLGEDPPVRCLYTTNERGFRVSCRGVMFYHCTYDSIGNRWIVWD